MHSWRLLRPRRSRPAGQVIAVPPPAAWFEVTYAIPGRCPDLVTAGGGRGPGGLRASGRGREPPASLVIVHPALISPRDVAPYGCMRVRDRRRFGEFDAAEAAGRAAAWMPAVLVDAGDVITTG